MNTRPLVQTVSAVVLALAVGACSKSETPKPEATPPAKTEPAKAEVKKLEAPPAQKAAGGVPKWSDAVGSYKIDESHSMVVFKVSHAGLSNTYGSFNKVNGKMTLDADATKSSVEIEVATASAFTADKKRDDHIKSPDFLNAKQFPTITFKSKSVKDVGEGKYEATGDFTLHGETKSVTITMTHVGAGEFPMDKSFRTGFEGTLDIKRTDYGMKNMIGPVGDDIRLIIAVEAIRE